jgi:hypothetical protein
MRTVSIRVKGRIDVQWSEWFNGFDVSHVERQGESVLRGAVVDQAALYGLLAKLRDVGLELVSVESEEVNADSES